VSEKLLVDISSNSLIIGPKNLTKSIMTKSNCSSPSRTEAYDELLKKAELDLDLRVAQTALAADALDIDSFDRTEACSAKYGAEEEVTALDAMRADGQDVLVQLADTRESLSTVGCDVVQAGTIVTLKCIDDTYLDTGFKKSFFIVPNGGGREIELSDGTKITCVSPETPIAEELIGLLIDDEIEIGRERLMQVASID
jgi:transcription elongation GreA/GreB family factor